MLSLAHGFSRQHGFVAPPGPPVAPLPLAPREGHMGNLQPAMPLHGGWLCVGLGEECCELYCECSRRQRVRILGHLGNAFLLAVCLCHGDLGAQRRGTPCTNGL